jgi:hypothetical protein
MIDPLDPWAFDVRIYSNELRRVLFPMTYVTEDGLSITIPDGFVTDFASIPRPLWPILRPDGRYAFAAVFHDYLYYRHRERHDMRFTRKHADRILLEIMERQGVCKGQRWAIYAGVRLGGRRYWGPDDKAGNHGRVTP